jgi:tetratricopeptide (TPR) repeat protein
MKQHKPHRPYGLVAFLLVFFFTLPARSETWEDLTKKATGLYAAGNTVEALESGEIALAEAEKEFGTSSIQLSRQLNLLADIHQKRGEWQEAARYLERLRSIQEAVLGPRNKKVANTLSALITVHEKQGNHPAAEELNEVASARWSGRGNPDAPKLTPVRHDDNDPAQRGPVLEKWKKLSETPNYIKIATLMADYHKKHQYLKEDFFVCSDMAIEVWDIIKTAGINARLIVGNIERDIVKHKSTHEYIAEMNHVWVMAEVISSEWVPVEATAGIIIHPKIPSFDLYYKGTYFDTPRLFKEFSESRRALFQTCKEAKTMVDGFNDTYAGKNTTKETLEHSGRIKQKMDDCENLERKVLSYLGS